MKTIFSLIVTTVLLLSQTINEQIHALEDASPEKRVELMNHIKEQLVSMNQEERMSTISILQEKLQGSHKQNPKEPQNNREEETQEQQHTHETSTEFHPLEQHEIHEQINVSHNKGSALHQELQQHEELTHVSQEQTTRTHNTHD